MVAFDRSQDFNQVIGKGKDSKLLIEACRSLEASVLSAHLDSAVCLQNLILPGSADSFLPAGWPLKDCCLLTANRWKTGSQ